MSERYYNSAKSKLVKHGEGKYHSASVENVINVLKRNGFLVDTASGVTMNNFSQFEDDDYIHTWDVKAWVKHDNKIMTELIVEIDGDSHDNKKQQFNDEDARKVAEFFYWLKGLKNRTVALGDFIFLRMPIEYTNDEESITNFLKKKIKVKGIEFR